MKNSIAKSPLLTATMIILGAVCVLSLPALAWTQASGMNRRLILQSDKPIAADLFKAARRH